MNKFDTKIMIEIADWTMKMLDKYGMITSEEFQKELGRLMKESDGFIYKDITNTEGLIQYMNSWS